MAGHTSAVGLQGFGRAHPSGRITLVILAGWYSRDQPALHLGRVAPTMVGVGTVRPPLSDYPVLNQVLTYCRGFTSWWYSYTLRTNPE